MIDRDTEWCERVCQLLASHQVEVVTATSEKAALQVLPQVGRPVAILIEPTSVDAVFTSLLSELPQLRRVPVYFVSSAAARDVFAKSVGVTGYVRKTVAVEHLMFLIGSSAAAPAGRDSALVAA